MLRINDGLRTDSLYRFQRKEQVSCRNYRGETLHSGKGNLSKASSTKRIRGRHRTSLASQLQSLWCYINLERGKKGHLLTLIVTSIACTCIRIAKSGMDALRFCTKTKTPSNAADPSPSVIEQRDLAFGSSVD